MLLGKVSINLNSAQNVQAGKEQPKITANKEFSTSPVLDDKMSSKAISNYFKGGQLVSFKGYACEKSDFKVKQEKDIPCACCGRNMLRNDDVKAFEEKAVGLKGKALQEHLQKNMDYFRGTEKAVVNFFMKTSKKNPNLTLKGLLKAYSPNAKVLLEEEQKNVLKELSEKAAPLGKDNAVEKCIQQAIKDIDNSNEESHFQRKPFLAKILNATQNITDKEFAGQLLDIAVKLPMSQNSIEAFIVKYSHDSRDDKAIAHRLAQTAVSTAEHIHPDTLGGPDNTANYVAECGDCNSKRGHMPLNKWMENFPNMPRSVQRNIDEVTERIINGNLDQRYTDYPSDVKSTFNRETNGTIKIKVKNAEEIKKARQESGVVDKKIVNNKKKRKAKVN